MKVTALKNNSKLIQAGSARVADATGPRLFCKRFPFKSSNMTLIVFFRFPPLLKIELINSAMVLFGFFGVR